nr:sugar ABC transporter ATP-binding protein [uncultured Albidiferax sp.]
MQGISKYFAGVPALRDASLALQAGEVHALIGQNGAGKSTMIKVMTGAYSLDGPQDAGRIRFEGRDVHFKSPQQARENGISTIYQEINLVPFASVAENIFLGREPRRYGLIDWPRIHREAQRAVASVGLSVDVRQPVSGLPTAAQQMVAIARAVSVDAKLVIMDESTSSLDDREVELLFGVIRQLKADGRTVVFVSHRLDELYAICDRVTVMRDGQTVHVSPMAAISKLDLVTTMLGKELSTAHRSGAANKRHPHQPPLLQAQALQAAPKLRGISLEVQAGETVGLAGLLGSGRTETMRLLFGADQPDAGTLRFNGQTVALNAPADAIAQGIAYLSEDRKVEGIFPELSVRENMTMVLLPQLARLGIVQPAAQMQVVDRFIAQLGIKTSGSEQPIKELSGGNQQKVLLARWLALSPKLLLLDEPTRGIDVGAKADIASLVHALAAQGMGILMSASELEELVSMSDRVVVLRDGRSIAEIGLEALSEQTIMSAMAEGHTPPEAAHHG